MRRGVRSAARGAALALSLAGVSAPGAQEAPRGPVRARTAYEDLQMFSQVLNQIRVNHPDSVDTHALLMSAIVGMVQAADPHSYVIPAMRLVPGKEQQLREGKLVPVPIQVLTYIVPARYFLVVLRGIVLKGIGVEAFWQQLLFLTAFMLIMLGLGSARLRKIMG